MGWINHKKEQFGKWVACYLTLAVVLFIGIVLLLSAQIVLPENGIGRRIADSFGIAIISAVLLGVTLDIGFRARLARSVFELAFGYLLPEPIRDEVHWVYTLDRLATKYRHDFVITQHPDNAEKVCLQETVSRAIKNIAQKPIEIKPNVGVQEWFDPDGESNILSFHYTHSNGDQGSLENDMDITLKKGYILDASCKKALKLYPGESVRIVWTIRETKQRNDATYSSFGIASQNPYLTVQVPDGISYEPTFQSRYQPSLLYLGNGHYSLNGTLLPHQAIRLRWWVTSDSTDWVSRQPISVKEGTES